MVDAGTLRQVGKWPTPAVEDFNEHAVALSANYESVSFAQVHHRILDCLPNRGSKVLDIGAGSGRDAAALAELGFVVAAVEPADQMLKNAKLRHGNKGIEWIQDALPRLEQLYGRSFKFVLLSAVWMFIRPAQRSASIRRIACLLPAGGIAAFDVLTNGPVRAGFFSTSIEELIYVAEANGMRPIRRSMAPDALGRAFEWTTLVFRREE